MDDSAAQNILGERYRLLRRVGKGGMGEVWLAQDPRLQRQVAIKKLSPYNQSDDEYLIRFEREARAAAALHHPHILPIHDYGQHEQDDGKVITYIVMPYITGGSVEERLNEAERNRSLLSLDDVFTYLSQAAEAIDYAHELGIVHRDIKPANMLLRKERWLLLADFGLARMMADSDQLTQRSVIIGTPKYMSPEQAQGKAVMASDIYSLAVIAYQLLTGHAPFKADTPYATIVQHMLTPPPSPRQFNSSLSLELEKALLCGLAKNPAERSPTASAFVSSLRQAMPAHLIGEPTSKLTEIGEREEELKTSSELQPLKHNKKPKGRSRRKLLTGLVGGLLLAGTVGSAATYILASPKPGPVPGRPQPTPSTGDGSPSPTMHIHSIFTKPVTQVTWSPTNNSLVALAEDNQMATWTIAQLMQDNSPIKRLSLAQASGLDARSRRIAWSPDGSLLAISDTDSLRISTGTLSKTEIYKSDLSGRLANLPQDFIAVNNKSRGLCWAPSKYIFTIEQLEASKPNLLHAFDVDNPAQNFEAQSVEMDPEFFDYNPLELAPNGQDLATTTQKVGKRGVLVGKVRVEDNRVSWKLVPILPADGTIDAITWSPDSRFLAAISRESTRLHVWDATKQYQPLKSIQSGKPLSHLDLFRRIEGRATTVAWSPDHKKSTLAVGTTDGKVYLLTLQEDKQKSADTLTSYTLVTMQTVANLTSGVTSLSWSSDGQWLAASFEDSLASILIWRLK